MTDRDWWSIYLEHGHMIHGKRLGHHRVSTMFDLNLNSARRLVYHVRVHGPPKDGEIPEHPEPTLEVLRPALVRPKVSQTHLVIGDAHAAPGQDLRRFEWLAQFCLEMRPDVVVSIGDWFGLDSLCFHHSKAEAEGQRLLKDLEAGNRALQIFGERIQAHNRAFPHDVYEPRLVVTLGNHDYRIIREAQSHPHLQGILDYDLMDWEAWGWETYPFREPVEIDGVTYCHYFTRPGSPRALSGMYHAAALVREGMGKTLVCGHSHQLHWYTKAGLNGERCHGLVVGCYFEHHEEYASTANAQWWRGLCLLRNVKDGDFDLETWGLKRIRDKYGDV